MAASTMDYLTKSKEPHAKIAKDAKNARKFFLAFLASLAIFA